MKKSLFFILCLLFFYKAQSQPYVIIPDVIFRAYIDSIVPGSIVGNTLNTSHPGLSSIQEIDVSYRGITDLTGVQYFPNLFFLYCHHNFLQSLSPLPANLSFLLCDFNELYSLPALPPSLTDLRCGSNNLSSLPSLPNNLQTLWCDDNNLSSLPVLPQNLGDLFCSNNQLTSLPALPPYLFYLYCSNNLLTALPTLPNSLNYLGATGNSNLWCLPNIPNNGNFYSDIGYLTCTPQGTPGTWYKMNNTLPAARQAATSFSIGSKCYLATGLSNGGIMNDLWEFYPATNTWTQKANLPAATRIQATSFSIGNKGYLGLGQGTNPAVLRDFWEYNPAANTWVQKANYPDSAYFGNAAFVIGNKGYVGCGQRSGYVFPNTFFEFNPVANTWTQKANFPGLGRTQAACFTIGNKGYVCGGDWSNGLTNSCYSYNPSTNSWAAVASLPQNINEAAFFSANGKGFVACGQCCYWNGSLVSTLMEFDPVLNLWTQRADIPTPGRMSTTGCALNGRGYVGTGMIYTVTGGYTKTNDWWEYTPLCTTPSNVIYASGNLTFCSGDSVMLFADNGNNYQWKKNGTNISGAVSQFYYAKTTGGYTCVISNSCSTVTSNQISVTVNSLPSATITPAGPTTFCQGGNVVLNGPVNINYTYVWKRNGVNISGGTSSSFTASTSGTYTVRVTNTATGCSKVTNPGIVVTKNPVPAASITPSGTITFCAGQSALLTANSGTGYTYKWKKNGNYISGATAINYTVTTAGKYRAEVTNSYGCTKTSSADTVVVPCREGENIFTENNFDVNVYPNPNPGEFTLKFSNKPSSLIQIEMTDRLGKVVKRFKTSDETVMIKESNLAKGIYCLTARNNDKVVIKKIDIVK